jgi:hypothetical protein
VFGLRAGRQAVRPDKGISFRAFLVRIDALNGEQLMLGKISKAAPQGDPMSALYALPFFEFEERLGRFRMRPVELWKHQSGTLPHFNNASLGNPVVAIDVQAQRRATAARTIFVLDVRKFHDLISSK